MWLCYIFLSGIGIITLIFFYPFFTQTFIYTPNKCYISIFLGFMQHPCRHICENLIYSTGMPTICCHPIYLFWFIAPFIFNHFIYSVSAPCESQPVQSGNVMGTEKANWQETLIVSFTHRVNNNIISIS